MVYERFPDPGSDASIAAARAALAEFVRDAGLRESNPKYEAWQVGRLQALAERLDAGLDLDADQLTYHRSGDPELRRLSAHAGAFAAAIGLLWCLVWFLAWNASGAPLEFSDGIQLAVAAVLAAAGIATELWRARRYR